MSEPFNADALFDELEAEAKPFTFCGESFTFPPMTLWSDEAIAAANAASPDVIAISRSLLGEDYDRFLAAGERAGKRGGAMFLQRLFQELFGLNMGESPASSSS
jgi:hypothetical protein